MGRRMVGNAAGSAGGRRKVGAPAQRWHARSAGRPAVVNRGGLGGGRSYLATLGLALGLVLGGLAGCRSREAQPPQGAGAAAVIPAAAAAKNPVVTPPAELPLGFGELAAMEWRERGGQEAFRLARAAERRGDWAKMVEHCRSALTVDATHLEASWLLAAGLSHLGRFAEVSAPLLLAVAGDPAKWALPALQLPLFAPYWASGQGEGLRPWIEAAQARLGAALGHSVILLQRGRLLAYDRQAARFLPLTRRLNILGALVGKTRVAYLALPRGQNVVVPGGPGGQGAGKKPDGLLGWIDLRTGALREVPLPENLAAALAAAGSATSAGAGRVELIDLAEAAAPLAALRLRAEPGPWLALDGEQLVAADAPPARTAGPRLMITGGRAQLVRLPAEGIAADWDQATMASALRIRRSNRLVALPAPALIDGQRVLWSPGGHHLALVASLEDCEREAPATPKRRAAAYVVDPITGAAREVAQSAGGLELEWAGPQLLALASDRGIDLLDLASGESRHLDGELSLGLPLRASRCAAAAAAVPPVEEPPLRSGDDLDDL